MPHMKTQSTIWIVLLLVVASAPATEMPSTWNEHLEKDASEVWAHCTDDGKFDATRLVGLYRMHGSQHDGDRQFEVATLLAGVEQDPYNDLAYILKSPDAYDVGFVLHVIRCLGDRRFIPLLEKMTGDNRSLAKWDMLSYKTVGGAAKQVGKELLAGDSDLAEDKSAKWLTKAQQPQPKQKKHNQ